MSCPFDQLRGRVLAAGFLACLLVLPVAGCAADEEDAPEPYQPASLGPADPSGVRQVTFTEEAARRIGLRTSPVTANGRGVLVDYAALIYDKQGRSWVYEAPQPLTFRRTKVTVSDVNGNRVALTVGPKPGTLVVTQGATQVYGAELEMAGKH